MLSCGWSPILDGAVAARARTTIDGVLRAVAGWAPVAAGEAASLAGGGPGHALLMRAVGRGREADHFLDLAVDAIAGEEAPPSLHGGFVGVAWVAEHLGDEPGDAVDAALASSLSGVQHDLMSGLAGLAIYALECLDRRRGLLGAHLDHLEQRAERRGGRATWRAERDGKTHLGAAHGVAGVVAVLGPMAAAGIGGGRARRLLGEAVAWMIEQVPPRPRLAWCTGDLGVAAALLAAARAVGEASWEREAMAIARRAAGARPDVADASFCHGAAGLGHVFNRLHQTTGDAACGDAARWWLTRALDLGPPPEKTGLLVGATGVALALAAALSTVEPGWDRLFGLSTLAGPAPAP